MSAPNLRGRRSCGCALESRSFTLRLSLQTNRGNSDPAMKRLQTQTLVLGLALFHALRAFAAEPNEAAASTSPVVFTTRQDHQKMLKQLGITRVRPGRNADTNGPNAVPRLSSCSNAKSTAGFQTRFQRFGGRLDRRARSKRGARRRLPERRDAGR